VDILDDTGVSKLSAKFFLKVNSSFNVSVCLCSCDEHYQMSEEHCGLDFDLVKAFFAKLSNNESLISEVMLNPAFTKMFITF